MVPFMSLRLRKLDTSYNKLFKLTFIAVFIFISLFTTSNPLFHEYKVSESIIDVPDGPFKAPKSSNLFEDGILYTGTQDALIINETAIFSNSEHYEIGNGTHAGITSQEAEFPIDTTHDWEGYYYNATISNIQDERDWVEDGNIGNDTGLVGLVKTTLGTPIESNHDYQNNHDANPSSPDGTINGNSDYIRIHFSRFEVETDYDYLFIYDGSNNLVDQITGIYATGFTSSLYNASTLKFSVHSDGSITDWGYSIDYYEELNYSSWIPYKSSPNPEFLSPLLGDYGNASSLGAAIIGDYDNSDYSFAYDICEVGFYEEITVPRGAVTNAWFSMDYYLQDGLQSNDFLIFCKINGDLVYTRGFGTILNLGRRTWHSTGSINLLLWENTSQIFSPVIESQTLNISVGISSPFSWSYTGDDVDKQVAFFDNISLVLKTEANCTQTGINLEFDNLAVDESSTIWGSGSFTKYDSWDSNPMQILLTTDAEKLEFDLYSEVYGFHSDSTHEQSNGLSGTKVTIFNNETVQWEAYHNVFVPSQYSDFEYDVTKPINWNITHVDDPTGLQYLSYLNGDIGDDSFSIETDFLGWWKFIAESDSKLITSSTDLWDDSSWKDFDSGDIVYDIGENIRIRTALFNPAQIGNLLSTKANLTVYYPNETIYYVDDVNPDGSGNIQFSDHSISAIDTVGGLYSYKILWMNGTSAGGVNGTFEIKHHIQQTLLYPRDSIDDLDTDAILGDIVPLRIFLNDSDNGALLSNLDIEYNWTSGNVTLNKIGSGLYDSSLDTLDLGGVGEYSVEFTISGDGYYTEYFTLKIHLTSETELKIIGLDNNIDYGTNFSIRLDYHTKPGSIGIPQAQISLNLSDYYITEEIIPGKYNIEINSTGSFPSSGIYDIQINTTCVNYQSQELITRIQILPKSIYFQVLINSADCSSNKSYSAKIQEDLNFTIGVFTSSGDSPVITGTVQLSDGVSYSTPFTIEGERYFNLIDSSFFGLGVNFISIIFNETGYQSASEVLQISITRINFNIEFESGDTLLIAKRSEFTTRLYLADPRTSAPMLNAIISFSWIFGTGFLTEIGNGYYEFSGTAPSQVGTYEIIFTVTPAESDYEIGTISMTLVSQQPETPLQWWWIIASAGLVVAVLSGSLIAIGVKNNRTKNREQEITKLKQKTQIFDDITNIKGILLIEKQSGLLMYRHVISGLDEGNEELFSGFIRAILLLGKRFIRDDEELEKGMVFEKQEFIEFTHENFKVLLSWRTQDNSCSNLRRTSF